MVKVNQIILNDFRNFSNLNVSFHRNLNIFYGENGSGKTNLLESISLISKGRGIRNSSLSNLIKKQTKNFYIKSFIEINKIDYEIDIFLNKISEKVKKNISVNNDTSKESINFLNNSISNLVFLPEMERLFQASPSTRRNFIDRLIFSEKNTYNTLINKYKKNLFERSKILQQDNIDEEWIKSIELQISESGLEIYKLRNSQIDLLNDHIRLLNNSNDYNFNIELKINDDFFNPSLDIEKYKLELMNSRNVDMRFGGSKLGPHKSDIYATINKNYEASQLSTGQQKTVVLMMLLAQCDFLVNMKKIEPILLLDEICSHLDANNRKILLDIIDKFDIQLFLTGTEKTLFSFVSTNAKFYNITDI